MSNVIDLFRRQVVNELDGIMPIIHDVVEEIFNDDFMQQFLNPHTEELERSRLMEWLLKSCMKTEDDLSRLLSKKGDLFHVELLESPEDYQILIEAANVLKATTQLEKTIYEVMAIKKRASS